MPVSPGEWVEFSAQVSTHRCTGVLGIFWRDATGNGLGPLAGETAIPHNPSSATNPNEWPRYLSKAQAPAGAAFAQAALRKFGTLAGASPANSYLMWHKPLMGPSHERQIEPSDYQPESPRFLPGGLVRNKSLLRAGAEDNFASDRWSYADNRDYPASNSEAVMLTSEEIAQLDPEGDTLLVSGTYEFRSTATAQPIVRSLARVRRGGVWGGWGVQASQTAFPTGDFVKYNLFTMFASAGERVQFRLVYLGANGTDVVGRNARLKLQRIVL